MITVTDLETTPLSGLNHIDALLDKGPDWNFVGTGGNTITYTFSTSSGIQTGSDVDGFSASSLRTFNAAQQSASRTAFGYLSTLTGIQFVETATGSAAQLHLAAADLSGAGTTGLSSWGATWNVNTRTGAISDYQVGAYVYLDNAEWIGRNNSPTPGSGGYETLLHELGHSLGLKHPFEGSVTLPDAQDTSLYTLMSYDHEGGPYAVMRPFDVAALNWLYGGDGLGGALGIGSATGARYITGTAAADSLLGTQFNDTLRGEKGNDMLDGAQGIDTAIFSGAIGSYTFAEQADGSLLVVGADGRDILNSVEYLQFSTGTVARAELADTTAPVITDFNVPKNAKGFVPGASPVLFGETEANALIKVYYEVNKVVYLIAEGTADANGNFSTVTTELGDGGYAVYATATDAAGNVSQPTALLNFNVDARAPVAPTLSVTTGAAGQLSGNQAAFKGAGEAGSSISLIDLTSGTLLAKTVVDNAGQWSVTTAPIANGSYSVTARSTDLADNGTNAAAPVQVSVSSSLNRTGTAGNDSLKGDFANNALDGKAGIDTAVYTGVASGYTVAKATYGYAVASTATGTDSLINVERLQIGTKHIALDIDGNGGQVFRLYAAAMDRAPDLGGLGFWMHFLDNGMSLQTIANYFLTSPEFTGKFGSNLTNAEFVNTMYQHVIHRAPEQAGFDFYMNAMDVGVSRADVLGYFSASPENQAQVIGSIQNGFEYTPYTG